MFVAYRSYSVILFAPVAALGAGLFTDPSLVASMFTGLFMDKMVVFVKNYLPVFLLGAVFGKVIELSGFSKAIVASVINLIGRQRAMLSIVLVCAILTYGGVSLFVVVFAVYPFAAEMFKASGIPTTFFKTNSYAAPMPGIIGAVFIFVVGMSYLEWQRRKVVANNEGYGANLLNEPEAFEHNDAVITLLAVTGLTHRQSYKDIFTISVIKTLAVFVVIGTYYLTGMV